VNNRWSWLALGVGAYLAFTLAAFPAGTALRWFAPQIELNGIRGTLWSGSAANGKIGSMPLQDLRWNVRAWTLLTGHVGANVEARLSDGFVSTALTASTRHVQFNDLRGGTSLDTLATVLPVRGMRGQASVALSSLEIENGWPTRVLGQLKLAGLEVAPFGANGGASMVPLGDYTITFGEAPPRSIAARFVDNGGPLEVAGSVTVSPAREYKFDALIKPRAGASEPLVEGLKIMTPDPDSEGRRRLTLTGSL
jgi:general secretion pathway protein N